MLSRIVVVVLLLGASAEARPRWGVSAKRLQKAHSERLVDKGDVTLGGYTYHGFHRRVRLPGHRGERDVDVIVKTPRRGMLVHEVAAYALSKAAGFHLVPPTFARPAAGQREASEMVQLFVKGRQLASFVDSPYDLFGDHERLLAMHLFDYLIGNRDRHGWNWLVADAKSELVAFDHEFATFPTTLAPYATYRSRMSLRDTTPTEANRLLFEAIDPTKVARALKATGLKDDEITGVLLRIENIRRTFPSRGSGRRAAPDGQLSSKIKARVRAVVRALE